MKKIKFLAIIMAMVCGTSMHAAEDITLNLVSEPMMFYTNIGLVNTRSATGMEFPALVRFKLGNKKLSSGQSVSLISEHKKSAGVSGSVGILQTKTIVPSKVAQSENNHADTYFDLVVNAKPVSINTEVGIVSVSDVRGKPVWAIINWGKYPYARNLQEGDIVRIMCRTKKIGEKTGYMIFFVEKLGAYAPLDILPREEKIKTWHYAWMTE